MCHTGSLVAVRLEVFWPGLGYLPYQVGKQGKEVKSCSEHFHLEIALSKVMIFTEYAEVNTSKNISFQSNIEIKYM